MTKRDYYEVLGVDRNATKNEIKIAYKKLALKYHPDVAHNDIKEEAEVKFREINEAYTILCDEEKRSMYDQFGHSGISGSRAQGAYGSPFGDFGGFGDIFDMFFDMGFSGSRGRGRRTQQATRGQDIRHDIEISLEQAFKGEEMNIDLQTYQKCPVCNGRRIKPGSKYKVCNQCNGAGSIQKVLNTPIGRVVTTNTCSTCNGQGRIPEEVCEECNGTGKTINARKITVNIPAGVDTGNRIRIPGEGEAGEFGGPPGDLYIFIHVGEHEYLSRQGSDLYCEIPIGFADAALGVSKTVETFEKEELIEIPRGIQSGEIIKLRGKGMPEVHGNKRGNFFAKIRVVTPTKLNKKQRELLKQFAKEGPQFNNKKSIFGKIMDAITGK